MKEIIAYTDGSCLGNPGVGGFASIIHYDGKTIIVKGRSKNPHETNNRMELRPVKHTLKWCVMKKVGPCKVIVRTDSQYACSCWKHDKHWLMTKERPNSEEWTEIITLCDKYDIVLEFQKISGHSGVEWNERADKLAYEQARLARYEVFGNGRK